MAMASGLIILLFVIPAALAKDYTVGDSSGWNQGVNYDDWASGKTFTVGDRLLFSYGPTHKVEVVNKDDYDNCAATNALQSFSDGSSTIPLNSTGPMYFLCSVSGHCSSGMKLGITVSAASNTPSGTPPSGTSPSSPTTPSTSPPTSTTPTPNTPTTTTTQSRPNGVAGDLYNMNVLVLGISLLLSPVLVFMG